MPIDGNSTIEEIIEHKTHLEYLAMMMLRKLDRVGLQAALIRGVKAEVVDEMVLPEFYGEEGNEESGCDEAGMFTVRALLDAWHDATNMFLEKMVDAPPEVVIRESAKNPEPVSTATGNQSKEDRKLRSKQSGGSAPRKRRST